MTEAPSSKLQAPEKHQSPNTKHREQRFGACNLELLWRLELGAWSFFLTKRGDVRRQAAFTLAEVLAALLFMAIVIPVAIEGLHIASRAGSVAERKAEAARVAQRVLNENLVTTNWNQSVQSGTITEGARTFSYTLHNDPWTQDVSQNVLRQLTAEVQYTAQGSPYFVRMSTLVDSTQQ